MYCPQKAHLVLSTGNFFYVLRLGFSMKVQGVVFFGVSFLALFQLL